jgi:phage terminase large subunit-like protein
MRRARCPHSRMPSVGLRLNEWTEQVTRWLDMSVWADGGAPLDTNWRDVKADLDELEERLAERRCYGELDLARVNDLSAFVLVFPPQEDSGLGRIGGRWVVVSRFWVPEEDILRRARRDRVPYDIWRDQGFLPATPGNATDFAFIEREILDLAGRFDIREIGYDRTFAGEIATSLQDKGLELIQFGQGFPESCGFDCRTAAPRDFPGALAWRASGASLERVQRCGSAGSCREHQTG